MDSPRIRTGFYAPAGARARPVTRKEKSMDICARRAFPAWAVPALLALLVAAPLANPGAARAAEGGEMAQTTLETAPTPTPATFAALPMLVDHDPPAMAAVMLAGAAVPPPVPLPGGRGPVSTDPSGTWRQSGIASWYGGSRWQGRPTASGVRFDDRKLTAAHASLPLGSRVRVTVAETGRSVVVTINDRPGIRTRVIDLSRAAAEQIGIVQDGLARVTLVPVAPEPVMINPA